MKIRVIYILFILLFTICANADEVNFTASVPRSVVANKAFRITYTIDAESENFKLPRFSGFRILQGPSTSSVKSIQFINGKMKKVIELTYTYVLSANNEGSFTIPPASINVNGKIYKSNSLQIEVAKARQSQSNNQQNKNVQQTSTKNNVQDVSSEELFIRTHISKRKAKLGEQITVSHKLYTRVGISGFNDAKFPSYAGFWSEEVKLPEQISLQQENINGVAYNVGTMKKMILFPQKTGKIVIEAFEVEFIVRKRVRRRSVFDDFFNDPFSDIATTQNVPYKTKSNRIVVDVEALPYSDKPINFSGAVGQFNISSSIDKTELKANEAITVLYKLTGSGNIPLINKLDIDFPPDFEVYDPKITNRISAKHSGVSGSRTFEYLLIPRRAGEYKLKPISFSYYDNQKKEYISKFTDEYTLNVSKGEGRTISTFTPDEQQDVDFIGSDIRFIKQKNFNLTIIGKSFFGSPLFCILLLLPLVLFILFLVLFKKLQKNQKNRSLIMNRRAGKVAKKRLKKAKQLMQNLEEVPFYEEISLALYGYVANKLNISQSEISYETLKQRLTENKVNQKLTDKFVEAIESCEYARFAPGGKTNKLKDIYEKSFEAIHDMENVL